MVVSVVAFRLGAFAAPNCGARSAISAAGSAHSAGTAQRSRCCSRVDLEEPPLFPEQVYANDNLTSVLRWTIEQERLWSERGDELDVITREVAESPYGPGITQGEATYPESVRALAYSVMVRDRGVTESAIDGEMVEGLDNRSPVACRPSSWLATKPPEGSSPTSTPSTHDWPATAVLPSPASRGP